MITMVPSLLAPEFSITTQLPLQLPDMHIGIMKTQWVHVTQLSNSPTSDRFTTIETIQAPAGACGIIF